MDGSCYFGRAALARNNTWIFNIWISDFRSISHYKHFGQSTAKDMYNKIIESIKDEGFEKTAIIFSISDTSKNGGSIGWIKKNSLNPKINKALEKINIEKKILG